MLKQVLFVTFLIFCALSQNIQGGKIGGYSDVDPASINSLDELMELKRIELIARKAYSTQNNGEELLQLTRIQRQVVAGLNYRLDFDSENGDIVEIQIFDQSWTHTTEVKSITRKA